jgi:hypothetical protein
MALKMTCSEAKTCTGRVEDKDRETRAVPECGEVERTGIEPVTSGLQSRRSPS